MSKKFEYELMLRLEKAEKAIASLASKIEKDLGKAVETAFKGSSEFDFSKHKDNLQEMIRYANILSDNQKDAAQYTLRLEKERLDVVRDRIKAEMEAADAATREAYERRQAESDLQAADERRRAEKQKGLESAFAGGVPLDVQTQAAERAEEEASRKRIQQIKDSSETKNRLAEQDHQRELQRIEGEDAERKKASADALKRIQDQQAADNARDADVYQRRQAEANIAASEKKAHDDKQKMYEKLWGAEKNAHTDRIAQIRAVTEADKAAQEIRYKDHTTVLSTIKEAHVLNASDLAAIEQRITTMTEAEAKQQLIAYQKTAKARVDYAIEQGYKLEAIEARQAANGARGVSAIFQVQQAIEDSMYAGLRGAGNNIAVLLTSISSSWVAIGGLIGVATLQLASHLGVFEKLNEAMDGALWKTKEQVRQEEYLARIRREDWERRNKQPIEAVEFNPAKKSIEAAKEDVATAEKKLAIMKEQQEALQFSIVTFERLQDKAAEMKQAFFAGDTEALKKLSEQYKTILADFNAGSTGLDVKTKGLLGSMLGESLELSGGGLDELKKRWEDQGSAVAEAADKLAVYREQLEKVLEVAGREKEQEGIRDQAMKIAEDKIEAAKFLVKTREDELQTIHKALEAAQRSLEVEERRADAIRKAASARDDEFAKQKLDLQNTILDMEANEKIKGVKDEAQSKEESIREQARRARQWAEQQAKVDKFNANQQAKLFGKNPQSLFNIDEQKAKWLQGLDEWEKRQLDMIKKTEQSGIESAKRIAEEAKKANLAAMKDAQMQKVRNLIQDAQANGGFFGTDPKKAIELYEEAQKTLKEVQNAEIANLKQKDSVQQGKDALSEIEALQEQLKEIDAKKLEASERIQREEKQKILQEMAREDQAAARLATAKTELERTLNVKEQIKATPLIDPNDLESVRKFREEMERILGLRLQIGGGGMGPMPAPGMGGQGQPAGGPAGPAGGGGSGFPTGPALPGNSGFSLTFNMNNATPNSVAAAANSIVQSQKAMAMLSGV